MTVAISRKDFEWAHAIVKYSVSCLFALIDVIREMDGEEEEEYEDVDDEDDDPMEFRHVISYGG